jgi:diguanylate cyclase (GGDEF)-like protein
MARGCQSVGRMSGPADLARVPDTGLRIAEAMPVPILIVDDDAATRLGVKAALAPLGHSLVEADSGLAALRRIIALDFAVILLDVRMPIMDGYETAALIRTRQQSEMTPIIFLTAHAVDEVGASELYAQGAVDFISSPVRPDELRAKVSVFANLFVRAEDLADRARELTRERAELEGLNDALTAVSRRDPLTGLGNRRALEEDLALLEARVTRYGHSYCMALIDVDHFKSYNDTYGHQAGDQVLVAVANELGRQARGGDALYRYGGEEFLCIFPEQSLETGATAVQRMRAGVEQLGVPHARNPTGVLTISAGLAVLDPCLTGSAAELLKHADEALYRAKQLGRNRVEQAELAA